MPHNLGTTECVYETPNGRSVSDGTECLKARVVSLLDEFGHELVRQGKVDLAMSMFSTSATIEKLVTQDDHVQADELVTVS